MNLLRIFYLQSCTPFLASFPSFLSFCSHRLLNMMVLSVVAVTVAKLLGCVRSKNFLIFRRPPPDPVEADQRQIDLETS